MILPYFPATGWKAAGNCDGFDVKKVQFAYRKKIMEKKFRIIAFLSLLTNCFAFSFAGTFPDVNKIRDTTVDTEAMTLQYNPNGYYGYAINGLSFQQEELWTHNGWQYVVYYNRYKHVCLARRHLPSRWEKIEFTDYTLSTTTDAHNVVTLGICPNNGTIHLSFDHHGGTLHYRVSEAGVATDPNSITWSTARFGPVLSVLEAGKTYSSVTYPRFWTTPNGNLQFGYRIGASGDGDWAMVDYNGTTSLWHDTRSIITRAGSYTDSQGGPSTKRNAYMNNLAYGPSGKLYATWCWRETAGGANHDIMYAFSNDGGYVWLNDDSNTISLSTGSQGAEIQTLLTLNVGAGDENIVRKAVGNPSSITLDSPGVKFTTLDRYWGLMNQQTQAVDSLGRIHTVMFHCTPETYTGYSWSIWGPEGARRYFHYWRDAHGTWHRNRLPGNVGSRPKLFIRSNGDAFLIYQSRRTLDLYDTGIYFTNGDLTIQAATAAKQWTDWKIIHTEPGFFLNEMLGDYYRFNQDGILSVIVQETPGSIGGYSKLRVLDFSIIN